MTSSRSSFNLENVDAVHSDDESEESAFRSPRPRHPPHDSETSAISVEVASEPSVTPSTSAFGRIGSIFRTNSMHLHSYNAYNSIRFAPPKEKNRKKQKIPSGQGGADSTGEDQQHRSKFLDEIIVSACMPRTKAWVKDKIRNRKYIYFPICFADILLRGVSQVYLMDHPIAGLLILAALSVTKPIYLYSALLGTLFSTLGAVYGLRGFTDAIFDGLYGYDGCLVGNAIFTFIDDPSDIWQMTVTTMVLAALAGIFQVALVFLVKRVKLPALTISFNIVTIFFLASVNGNKTVAATIRNGGPGSSPIYGEPNFVMVLEGTVKGVGQFIFADTIVGGALIYFAIFMCKRVDSFGALMGSFVSTLTAAYIHRVSPAIMPAVRDGLWSYNGMGCGAAFASGLFTQRTIYNFLFGMVAAALSVMAMAGWSAIMNPLPILTFPFVSTVMLTLLARHAGEEAQNSILAPDDKKGEAHREADAPPTGQEGGGAAGPQKQSSFILNQTPRGRLVKGDEVEGPVSILSRQGSRAHSNGTVGATEGGGEAFSPFLPRIGSRSSRMGDNDAVVGISRGNSRTRMANGDEVEGPFIIPSRTGSRTRMAANGDDEGGSVFSRPRSDISVPSNGEEPPSILSRTGSRNRMANGDEAEGPVLSRAESRSSMTGGAVPESILSRGGSKIKGNTAAAEDSPHGVGRAGSRSRMASGDEHEGTVGLSRGNSRTRMANGDEVEGPFIIPSRTGSRTRMASNGDDMEGGPLSRGGSRTASMAANGDEEIPGSILSRAGSRTRGSVHNDDLTSSPSFPVHKLPRNRMAKGDEVEGPFTIPSRTGSRTRMASNGEDAEASAALSRGGSTTSINGGAQDGVNGGYHHSPSFASRIRVTSSASLKYETDRDEPDPSPPAKHHSANLSSPPTHTAVEELRPADGAVDSPAQCVVVDMKPMVLPKPPTMFAPEVTDEMHTPRLDDENEVGRRRNERVRAFSDDE